MTKDETSARIQAAIVQLTAAKRAVDAETGHASTFTASNTGTIEIVSSRGTVTVSPDGTVSADPNEILIQKSVTDSVLLNERYAMIAAPKGSRCPTCGGNGTL